MICSIFKYFNSDFTDPLRNNAKLADFIDDALSGAKNQGPYEWEDFTIFESKYTNVENVRQEVIAIAKKYPAKNPKKRWCSKEGEQALRDLAEKLRNGNFKEKGLE
ncbi:hypothetical protein [Robiginitomaculum antarcticum]|uniref:hypothetical protein n=1 Tax=Robiginitomaculum antarcticum TaxID=437507 RepID=UPI00037316EA|nr:hypothetical protein [Robiginitomaculum antarcticum]